jgi:hypothetical protein
MAADLGDPASFIILQQFSIFRGQLGGELFLPFIHRFPQFPVFRVFRDDFVIDLTDPVEEVFFDAGVFVGEDGKDLLI